MVRDTEKSKEIITKLKIQLRNLKKQEKIITNKIYKEAFSVFLPVYKIKR